MTIIWELHYDRTVTALLYSLRGSETGTAIHEAIKALQFKADPTEDMEPIKERQNRYQFEVNGYRVRIETVEEMRKAIRILSVKQK